MGAAPAGNDPGQVTPGRNTAMQIFVAFIALPAVALLLALASRLDDGLRAPAPARAPLALTAGPAATPAEPAFSQAVPAP